MSPDSTGPYVALTAHLDTVLTPRNKDEITVEPDGRFRGPGVSDNGAGLAALMAVPGSKPKPPENPMSADRVRWEHIQRVYELCGHNVSETARRLNMHRRTLQRILAKRSPR